MKHSRLGTRRVEEHDSTSLSRDDKPLVGRRLELRPE
jgi:hypothetical protein